MNAHLLTKTRFLNGLQSLKLLWVSVNQPETLPETDIVSHHIFEQGHEIDELAKKLYPNGIDIPTTSFVKNIQSTEDLLNQSKPLFQAGFKATDVYSRLDIILPDTNEGWELIEVKSSTEIKPEHLPDVAFQKYCCEKAGLLITKCSIIHVNNKYIRNGDIKPEQLLITEDITESVNEIAGNIDETAEKMLRVMASSKCPECAISAKCSQPRDCPMINDCFSVLPENHILTLYYGKQKGYTLLSKGVEHILDIPPDIELNTNQKIQFKCVQTNIPHIAKTEIQNFLDKLQYPVAYFDFETISSAVPLYDGMRPYQKIPFQFSLVIVPSDGSSPQQYSFIARTADDPRPALLAEMRRLIPNTGSIVVYNKSFEGTILKQLGEAFPTYQEWIASIVARIEDLLEPFRNFHYYHPSQKGSVSMKGVLPALTGRSYEGMSIHEGETASILYWNVTHKPAAIDERNKVYADLEAYCGLDTDGMRSIVKKLGQITSK